MYASYDEWTYCMPVMMGGLIVHQLSSYDEETSCTPVMMSGPIVCQLWWGDLLYVSHDEWTYCIASYDEWT